MNNEYKILIIDDDLKPLRGHIRLLQSEGYSVETVETGEGGLTAAIETHPHLIILDVVLPDIDGVEVCRQLKSKPDYKAPYIVMLSAKMTCPDNFIKGFEAGADDYLAKPIVKEVLLARINAIFRMIKAEKALAEEKDKFYITLKSIGDGVIATDLNGKIAMINDSAEILTGWSQEEAFGKPIEKVFYIVNKQTRTCCENPIDKVLKSGSIVGLANNTILIAKNGTERIIADSSAPIFDADKKIIGAVLVFRDITDKHRMEKQLQQSQKIEAIGTLAGGIAHDFNNMLGIIFGNVSYLLNQFKANEELVDVLSDIQEGTKKAQSLTQQLLTFSMGGAPVKKVTDVKSLIKESSEFVVRGAKTRCSFDLPDDLWVVEVDSGQLNQVFTNLIINANQAMPNGGVIIIRSENIDIQAKNIIPLPMGKYIKITIEDQGVGISEKHLPNIFDPYFSTKQAGSGFGLATSYSIITRHGGHIWAESKIDEGTTFYIYLPASEKEIIQVEDKANIKHSGNGKILIMDDQESILKMVGRMLNFMGYDTVLTTDGAQAIDIYNEAYQSHKPFDVVILDLTVPGGMGGAQVIPELLKIDPKVKAVVSSGYSNDPIMSNYEDYGFCGVIPKPYSENQLSELLNKIINGKN